MKLIVLHDLLREWQQAVGQAKTQAEIDKCITDLRVALSRQKNGAQIVALIDWSKECL